MSRKNLPRGEMYYIGKLRVVLTGVETHVMTF